MLLKRSMPTFLVLCDLAVILLKEVAGTMISQMVKYQASDLRKERCPTVEERLQIILTVNTPLPLHLVATGHHTYRILSHTTLLLGMEKPSLIRRASLHLITATAAMPNRHPHP
jgi:hypothetical protein